MWHRISMMIYYNESCFYIMTALLVVAVYFSARLIVRNVWNRWTIASLGMSGLLSYELFVLVKYFQGYPVQNTNFIIYAIKLAFCSIYFYELGKKWISKIYQHVWAMLY